MFSSGLCKIFKFTFFTEHPWGTTSLEIVECVPVKQKIHINWFSERAHVVSSNFLTKKNRQNSWKSFYLFSLNFWLNKYELIKLLKIIGQSHHIKNCANCDKSMICGADIFYTMKKDNEKNLRGTIKAQVYIGPRGQR